MMGDKHENHVRRFRLVPPYDASGVLAYLAGRAIPGVESISTRSYHRTLGATGLRGIIGIRVSMSGKQLVVECPSQAAARSREVETRLRRVFDLRSAAHEAASHLARDPKIRPIIRLLPGLRVPGGWDGFELAVRAVLGQQVSVKGATTLAGRLVQAFGKRVHTDGSDYYFPSPRDLADADVASIGMPRARGRAISTLAARVCSGAIDFSAPGGTDLLQAQIMGVPGIGPWTAQYVAMRALHEPDAYPAADLGLLRAASGLGLPDKARALEDYAERWRPYRAYAVMALWRSEALGSSGPRAR